MSFLFNRSVGGPDEDWAGREVTVTNPDSGEVVGKATLLEQVPFTAAYSQVYKCIMSGGPLDGQLVCAKVLTTGNSHTAVRAEPLLRRLYDRELTALTKVKHRHVIRLMGVGEVSFVQQDTAPTSPSQLPALSRGSSGQHGCVDVSMIGFADHMSSPRALGSAGGSVGHTSAHDRVSHLSGLCQSMSVGISPGQAAGAQTSSPSSHTPAMLSGSGNASVPLPSRFSSAAQDIPLPSRFSAAAQELRASTGGTERPNDAALAQRKPQLSYTHIPDHSGFARTAVSRSSAAAGSIASLDSPLRRSFQKQMLAAMQPATSPFATGAAAAAAGGVLQGGSQPTSTGSQPHQESGSPQQSGVVPEETTPVDVPDALVASRQSSSYMPYVSPSVLFAKQPSSGGSFLQANRSVFGMPHRPIPSLTFMRRSTSMAEQANPIRRVLFLEWMSGGDARSLIEQARQPMEEQAAATIILPITQALAAAHMEGVVHRDVKAGNILLAPGLGEVRLADWGISVHESESSSRMSGSGANSMATMPGTVGTQYWCAPELEMGHAHGTQSDIFSLAITFIELVTGRDPKYDNQSEAGYNLLVDAQRGIVPQDLSQAAASWLLPCLSYNPSQRPSAQALLQHEYFTTTLQQLEQQEQDMADDSQESKEENVLKASHGLRSADSYPNLSVVQFSDEQRGSEHDAQQASTNLLTSIISLNSKRDPAALDATGTTIDVGLTAAKCTSQGVLDLVKKRTVSGLMDGAGGGRLDSAGAQARCRAQAPLPDLPASESHAVVAPEIVPDPYLDDVPDVPHKVSLCGCSIS